MLSQFAIDNGVDPKELANATLRVLSERVVSKIREVGNGVESQKATR